MATLQWQMRMYAVSLHVNESDDTVSLSQNLECLPIGFPHLMQFRHALPASKWIQGT